MFCFYRYKSWYSYNMIIDGKDTEIPKDYKLLNGNARI